MSCENADPIVKNYLWNVNWELRHRLRYDPNGNGIHGGVHSEEFDRTFWDTCSSWIANMNHYAYNYGNKKYVDWVGDVGVMSCRPPSYHAKGRAIDLTHLRFTNLTWVDMNTSWKSSSLSMRRRYLAVAASCRCYFGTVLTAWYNNAHKNHIHIENNPSTPPPIRTNLRTDTTLIQAACNWLNGAKLVVDGAWGPNTSAAYNALLRKFGMDCYNPRTNVYDMVLLMTQIMKHSWADRSAGAYPVSCSSPKPT